MPTAIHRSIRAARVAAAVVAALAVWPASPALAAATWVALPADSGARATLEKGRELLLLVQARRGDDYASIGARYLGPGRPVAEIIEANPGRERMREGSWYRLPVALLSSAWREKALRAVFPADRPDANGWVHRPSASPLDTYGEGAWEAALWFTGDGRNFETVLRANGLTDPILRRSADITIPAHLLLGPFRAAWEKATQDAAVAHEAPADEPPSEPAPIAAKTTGPAELTFDEDNQGGFAAYRLKAGEALYSSVVVRFTGRVDPEDVSEAASTIAARSGIAVMTNIPVGYIVKIPRDLVLPEFLPPDDRKRRAVEEVRREAESVHNPIRTRNLQGIHVILDAGHGGVDPGALIGGVAEHEVAYDVMCRVKRLLETETAAIVHPTIEDPIGKFEPRGGRVLPVSGREEILTTPAHVNGDPGDTSLGVNLRWILANAIQRKLARAGVEPAKIVFVSFHADVLHPSLRGAMVYVPGEQYRRGSYACYDPDCGHYAEARQSAVSFTKADRMKSEGLSREFAGGLVRALTARGIRIHPYEPVRDRIIRRGRAWLPAVLRGNSVPVKVLVEMANLNNPEDRARLQDAAFRESFARAFTDALLRYYRPADSRPARGGPRSSRTR